MKIKIILLALALTLTILFTGSYFVDSYKLNHSLSNDLLKIKGVEDVEIEKSKVAYQVKLTLVKVDNLTEVYEQVNSRIRDTIKDKKYKLILNSQLSPELSTIYEEINLALYEALETGEFVKLGVRVESYSNQYQLDKSEIKVDGDYIYLTLTKDQQELYKVVARNKNKRVGGELNG